MKIIDYRYLAGAFLLAVSFIASVVSLYLIVFAWIPFVIGVTLIFISSKKWDLKIATISVPLLLYIPVTLLLLYLYNYTSPKIYLIPESHSGTLRIIYDEECGQHYQNADGKRLIQFPNDGILILNEKFDGGSHSEDAFFLYNENGKRSKIEGFDLSGSGAMSADHPTSTDFHYVEFSLKTHSGYNLKEDDKFDSLTIAKVRNCRHD